jgi:hypothetical protein
MSQRDHVPIAIEECIRRTYGEAVSREYSQINGVAVIRPYQELFDKWSRKYATKDVTEMNFDVSFAFFVDDCIVRLSMAGPYAMVEVPRKKEYLLVSDVDKLSMVERSIVQDVLDEGFMILDKSVLSLDVDLWSESIEPNTVYSCLFVDLELPSTFL